MRLNQVTVPATDIARSTDFYLRLGLRQIVAAPLYARFVCPEGDSTFSIEKADVVRPGIVVYFECDDLDSRVAGLKQCGITFDSGPVNQSWLWREARCSDPDGNQICLYFAGQNRLQPPWVLDPPRQLYGRNTRNWGASRRGNRGR
jgi:catechol 2,3-dioxygenase-like lactoylglutathione lyase family enzyme